jgi:predicted nucleic acid-binding protein
LACSSITLAEVLVGPARSGVLGAARDAVTRLGVEEIPLGEDAAARLATLRAETNLKLPDCCVLLAAEHARGTRVLTFDQRLAMAAADRGFDPR